MTFRSNFQATVDARGRLKVPARFRDILRREYGGKLFITCLYRNGECAQVYPLPLWERFEKRLARVPPTEPARRIVEDAANYYGLESDMDKQGRALISQVLRKKASIEGREVWVIGKNDHLDVWNRGLYEATRRVNDPVADLAAHEKLAQYGVWDDDGDADGGNKHDA